MKALVFAAGLGTRLRPLTDSMPKALVPVAGVPMLERVILKLEAAGFDEFVVNTHHFAQQIEDFVALKQEFGASVRISRERHRPLETGGGIKFARPLLEDGDFLVHNADILSDADIPSFVSRHRPDSLATLLVHDAPAGRCFLFNDSMRLVGWTDTSTGEIRSPYPDLDLRKCRRLSFAGIHVISRSVFPLMEDWPDVFSITDFYIKMCAEHTILGVEAKGLRLIDIGSPEKLREAEVLLRGGN